MTSDYKTTLTMTLAGMLVGKQIDTSVISASLQLLCKSFSFDCGLVYGRDQDNFFFLKERYILDDIQLCEGFFADAVSAEYRYTLAHDTITHIRETEQNTSHEADMLKRFNASSLVLVSSVDEQFRIFGFVAFANKTLQEPLSSMETDTLGILIPMLMRYIGIRMYQSKLSFAQTSLESILDNTGIDIYVNDFYTHDVLYVNRSMAAPYGGPENFVGQKCWKVLFPGKAGPCEFCPQSNLIDEQGNPTKTYTWDYQRPFDGAWFRVFSSAFRWVDGRLAHVISSADITDSKRNEELIRYMANYDSLTNLPNRRMLIHDCDQLINNAIEKKSGFLLFFDIDGFKAINDNLGHDAGDEFLVQLGAFFSGIPLLQGKIYRHGGDEFVALLGDEITEGNVRSLASFIHERFKKGWILKKGTVCCNTSIGVARYPEDGVTAEELLYKADQAMYQIKKSGGGGIHF